MSGALALLTRSRLMSVSAEELGRQLLVERSGLRVILVRPADVPAYVDHGAADLGIVGKDILWESPGSHYELVDLCFGACRLVLAVPDASSLDGPGRGAPARRQALRSRGRFDLAGVGSERAAVAGICARVRDEGDAALRELGLRFDGWAPAEDEGFEVGREELESSSAGLQAADRAALE